VELNRKFEAENDDHPLSQDWSLAPAGTRKLYQKIFGKAVHAILAGEGEARFRWSDVRREGSDRQKAQFEWLCKGNGAPLIEHVEGDIWRMLKDPSTWPHGPYPGWDPEVQGEPVWTKKCVGKRLPQLVFLIRSHFGGAEMKVREVAAVINQPCFREAFGIEDCRAVSDGAVSKAQVSLRKEGMCRIVKPAVHYRQNHHWKMESAAVYRTGLELSETDPLRAMISEAIASREAQKKAEREERQREWKEGWAA